MPEMNPNQSLPTPNPEALPTPPSVQPESLTPVNAEAPGVEAPAPQEVRRPSTEVGPQNAGAPPQVVALPTPIVPAAPAATAQDDTSDDPSHPMVADDVDVIEKEWVEKAKSIVQTHRDDPYKQEQEANRLQSSYLKKRYGKSIKKKA